MCFQVKISMSMAGTGNHFVYNMAALAHDSFDQEILCLGDVKQFRFLYNLGATNGICIPGHIYIVTLVIYICLLMILSSWW